MGIPAAGQHSDGLAGPGEVLQALSEGDLAVGDIVVVHGEQAETVLGRVLSRQCPRPRRRDSEPSAPPARRAPMAGQGRAPGVGGGPAGQGRGWSAPRASRGTRPWGGFQGGGRRRWGELRGEREDPAQKVGGSSAEGERHRLGGDGPSQRGSAAGGGRRAGGRRIKVRSGAPAGERKARQVGGVTVIVGALRVAGSAAGGGCTPLGGASQGADVTGAG